MTSNSGVRFIFKEWPIFADRWAISRTAAVRGLQVCKQKGATGYLQYHNGLYQTGHNEGALTADDIAKASQAVAFDDKQAISQDAALAMLQDTTVIPGAASAEELQRAIDLASRP